MLYISICKCLNTFFSSYTFVIQVLNMLHNILHVAFRFSFFFKKFFCMYKGDESMKIIQKIKKRLKKYLYYYRKIRLLKILDDPDLNISSYKWVSYIPQFNLTYNHIGKSGSSNISKILLNLLQYHGHNLKTKRISEENFFRSKFMGLTTNITYKNFNKVSDGFKFTFVRNPYNRVLSMYSDRIVNKQLFNSDLGILKMNKDGFTKFIDFLENGGTKKNIHFYSQTQFLFFKLEQYNFIGKLENFEENFIQILDTQNISYSNLIHDLIHNKFNTKHVTKSENFFSEIYDSKLLNRVYKLYKEDFNNFGYQKEIFDE